MNFTDIPLPEVYKESADFRFFIKWIELCLSELQYKTTNLIDLLDPLRCPSELLWMLADTCGYKYDERASVAFNRFVILYFATLIMNRGSKTGVSFAAEMNLAQFNLQKYAEENPILEERLEDTTVPTNSVAVTAHPDLGFIDIVYYSEKVPTDICLEYVRPIGMYCFSTAGVVVNARTKVSVDARLTNLNDGNVNPGPAFVARYRRSDYASLQRFVKPDGTVIKVPDDLYKYEELTNEDKLIIQTEQGDDLLSSDKYKVDELVLEKRNPVYYRNIDYEKKPTTAYINPGYRSLYSLQLSNNNHIVKSLMPSLEKPDEIFSLGYGPQNVDVKYPDSYLKDPDEPLYNLRIDSNLEKSFTPSVYTVGYAESILKPKPGVNPVMMALGDAISLDESNTKYTRIKRDTGELVVDDLRDDSVEPDNQIIPNMESNNESNN